MQKFIYAFILVLFCGNTLFAQCNNPYYQYENGTKVIMETYDGKGKKSGKIEYTYSSFEQTDNGFEATVETKNYDKNDKLQVENSYNIICDGNTIKFDAKMFVPEESMKGFENMEFELETDNLEIPASLSVGQELDDAYMKLKTTNMPLPMGLDFKIYNRKVEGKETVTTPAGSFECYKITYDTNIKTIINANFKNIEYLTEKYGVIKTESYKNNGKLFGTTVITEITE